MPKPSKYSFMLMRALKKLGVHFRSESFDGHKHVDIVIPASKIDIEVDGRQHVTSSSQVLSDLERSSASAREGFDTVHITNHDVYENVGGVASAIAEASATREENLKVKHG
jgi:very-short-patch-repair endonuclease